MHEPEELLNAMTVNGMRSLGWDGGLLREGMLADFVTLEHPSGEWREISPAHLVFGFSGRDVTNVVVGGETVISTR